MAALRECVCGCGREIPRQFVRVNLQAFTVMLELMEWDRFRWFGLEARRRNPESGWHSEELDRFMLDGATYYSEMLDVLHEQLPISAWDSRNT